jgi:hypothetical protein
LESDRGQRIVLAQLAGAIRVFWVLKGLEHDQQDDADH